MRQLWPFVVLGVICFTSVADAQEQKPEPPIWSSRKDKFGDPLPAGAIARIGSLRYRLPPLAVNEEPPVLSPNGKLLAIFRSQAEIEIMQLPEWKRYRLITGASVDKDNPAGLLQGFAFSADCKKGITIAADKGKIHLLDLDTGKSLKALALRREERPAGDPRISLAPDEKTFCFLGTLENQGGISCWDLVQGKALHTFGTSFTETGHEMPMAISSDCRWATQHNDQVIGIYDLATGKLVRKIETDEPTALLAFSPDRKWLAAWNGKSVLAVYDANTGKEKHHIRLRPTTSCLMAFSPDSAALCVADESGTVSRWDLARGELKGTYPAPVKCPVSHLAFQADGTVLAMGFDSDSVRYWDVERRKLLSPAGSMGSAIHQFGFSPSGELFLASGSGEITRCNSITGARPRKVQLEIPDRYLQNMRSTGKEKDRGMGMALPSDPNFRPHLFMSSLGNFATVSEVGIFDANTGKLLYGIDSAFDPGRSITDFFQAESKAATIRGDKVRLWDTRTGKDFATFKLPLQDVEHVKQLTVSPSGRFFGVTAAGNQETRVFVWDADKKKIVSERHNVENLVMHLKFSADNRWLFTLDEYGLRLHPIGKSKACLSIEVEASAAFIDAAFSPDSRQLACVLRFRANTGDEQTADVIRVYEVATRRIRVEYSGQATGIGQSICYSPDSSLLATASTDSTALIWKAGLRAFKKKPAAKAVPADQLADWHKQMVGPDAKVAFQGMIKFVQTPQPAVKHFEAKIAPAQKFDPGEKSVAQWIADIGNSHYAVRSKASTMLQRIGASVEPDLRAALPKAKDVETKRRIEELLEHFASHEWTQEEITHARAVEVVEAIGTPEARALLTRWAGGDAGAVLTLESRQALKRVK